MQTKKIPKSKRWPRTISEELFEQWRKAKRVNDAGIIAELLGRSKPTIEKALIYGFCQRTEDITGITNYFADRLTRELQAADNLKNLLNSK